jgi:hypothetical protein
MNTQDEQQVRKQLEQHAPKPFRGVLLKLLKSMYNLGYSDGLKLLKTESKSSEKMTVPYTVLDQQPTAIMATVRIAFREWHGRDNGETLFEAFREEYQRLGRARLLLVIVNTFKLTTE